MLRRDLIAEAKRWNERESRGGACERDELHQCEYTQRNLQYLNHAQYHITLGLLMDGRDEWASMYVTTQPHTLAHREETVVLSIERV